MTSLKRIFKFHGHDTGRDLAHLARNDGLLKKVHARFSPPMSGDRAMAMIEDMLAVALHGAGEHFLGRKGAVFERIVQARMDLLAIFEKIATEGPGADIRRHLPDLERLYHDLENGIGNVQKHLTADPPPAALKNSIAERIRREVKAWLPAPSPHAPRAVAEDLAKVSGRSRLMNYRYYKAKLRDAYVRRFKDGASAELTVQGKEFHIRTFDRHGRPTGEFHEYHVVLQPYGSLPRTGPILQFHHGIESDLMGSVFGQHYDPKAVPTICLRDNKTGSPHGMATARGNAERPMRGSGGPLTYAEIRELARGDLGAATVPDHHIETYLAAIDFHVRTVIVPKLTPGQRARMLGSWTP